MGEQGKTFLIDTQLPGGGGGRAPSRCDTWYRQAFDPSAAVEPRIDAVSNLARECRTHDVFQAMGWSIANTSEPAPVRRAMVHALASWEDSIFATSTIARALSMAAVRAAAIDTLERMSPARGEKEARLLRELNTPQDTVPRLRMLGALGKLYGRDPRVLSLLGELLRTGNRWERALAASELWGLGEVPAALGASHDPDIRVRKSLAVAIERYPDERGAAALLQLKAEEGAPAPFHWPRLLDDLSELYGSPRVARKPGAAEAGIQAAERRLGLRLPPSYRAFLLVSNGFARPSSFIPELYGAAALERFAQRNAQWADAYRELYPDLGECLQVSAAGDDAVMLLNPNIVDADGEWAAYFFANWIPGARKYTSFQDWLRDEVDSLCEWRNH